MAAVPNPFRASFGVSPPLLVGRDDILEGFAEALDDGPGAAGRATLLTGARGAGKTALLNAVEDHARERGWLVVSETASPGFLRRIGRDHLPRLLRDLDPDAVRRHVTGVTAPMNIGAVTWDTTEAHVPEEGMRHQVEVLTDVLREDGTGLLITLDEIHQNQLGELREFAVAVQHAFREERQLAFVGAGLAASVSDVVNDAVLTFLRRAERRTLGRVARSEVERAFREPIERGGRAVTDAALRQMADASGGYPFLLQLIGAQTWRVSPAEPVIGETDARVGIERALQRLGALVHEPALAVASDVDRLFLRAMARDDGPTTTAELATRLGVDANYVSQYRRRLLAAELVVAPRRGELDFALPYLREYLREHADPSA